MTNTNIFRTIAKDAIVQTEKELYGRDVSHEEIELVFMGYVLGNIKGTFVVARNTEGRYYEVTYSNSANKLFIDEYKKSGTRVIDL